MSGGVLALVLLAGSCSGSKPPVKVTRPAPGHGSPAAAVVGFFSGLVKGDKRACTYAAVGATPFCLLALENTKATFANLGIGQVTIEGSEALVTVVGRLCVTQAGSTNCTDNSNPRAGQPGGGSSRSFQQLYRAALKGLPINRSALPCERINSQWYLSLST